MTADDREVRDFLARSRVARMATLSAKGTPHILPYWFFSHRERIYVGTGPKLPTVRNISPSPNVVLLLDAERGAQTDRVLRIQGRATFRSGIRYRAMLRFAAKYFLAPGDHRHMLRHFRKLLVRQRYLAEREAGGLIETVTENAEFLPRNLP